MNGSRRSSALLLCLGIGGAVNLSGCGGATVEARPAVVVTHREPEKPELGLVERDGDPQAALGAAVFTRAPARVNAHLARAAALELAAAGYEPTTRAADNALLVSVLLPNAASAQHATERLRHALLEAKLPPLTQGVEPVDACDFTTAPLSAAQTRAEIGQRNTRLVMVGSGDSLQKAVQGYENSPAWPEGAAVEDPWPGEHHFEWVTAARPDSLLLGVRTADAGRALAAQRNLAELGSTLNSLARALEPEWQVSRVHTTLRPKGACLGVELSNTLGQSPAPGHVARLFAEELSRELDQATASAGPLQSVSHTDPRDAALSAAWASFGDPSWRAERRWSVRYTGSVARADAANPGSAESLEEEFGSAAAPPITLRHQPEQGQGRVWVLLTSACPTAHEDREHAGHTFAALAAAASLPSLETGHDVRLEPWLSGANLGVIASAPSGPGVADAIARRLGRALLDVSWDEPLLAATRDRVLDAQPAARGWTVTLDLLSGGAPARLAPSGLGTALARFSGPSADQALRGFLQHPLTLAVSGNAGADQARALTDHLSRLLWPLRSSVTPCQAAPVALATGAEFAVGATEPALPARETPVEPVTTLDRDVVTAWIGFATPAAAWAETQWTARLLNGPRGWLAKSVMTASAFTRAEAVALATADAPGALVIVVQAPAASMALAVAQTRELLGRLGALPPPSLGVGQLVGPALEQDARARRDPRVRLSELVWPPVGAPNATAISRLLKEQLAPQRAIVVRSNLPSVALN